MSNVTVSEQWALPTNKFPKMSNKMQQIMREVCEHHNVRINEMFSKSRESRIVHARREYVYRCRKELPNASFPRIGESLNQDHTTALYSYHLAVKEPWRMEPFKRQTKVRARYNFKLTERQITIKRMVEEGVSINEIAQKLNRTKKQVSADKYEIMRKMKNKEKFYNMPEEEQNATIEVTPKPVRIKI